VAADRARLDGQLAAAIEGHATQARSVPCVRKDGTVLLADIRASITVVDGVLCSIAFVTDVTELRRLETEDRQLARAVDQTSEAILITGPTGQIRYANPAFERLSGCTRAEIEGGMPSLLGSPHDRSMFGAMWRTLTAGGSWFGDLVHRRPDGTERVAVTSITAVHDADGSVAAFVAMERDVTDERAMAIERDRLAAAVEQTSDSVMVTDRRGTIEYVNPAFERVSGYSREEAIGANPRILRSGVQAASFYRSVWRRLGRGQTWSGTLINRRKDGELYEEEATISPLRDPLGLVTGYVAVKRDVTALRAAESGLAREFRERAAVAAALARLQPGPTAEATASVICDALVGLPGIHAATIFSFPDAGRAVPRAVSGPDGLPFSPGLPLPAPHAGYLRERAAQGPWAEATRPRLADWRSGEALTGIGILASAYAPIQNGAGLLGLVAIGTRDEAYARHLIDHLPAVGEFAATASALLSGQLERGHRDALARERIQRVLAERAFEPVFQPIVSLVTSSTVGYEALTRFADGTPPDRMIADAHAVGLGQELEIACLQASLEASEAVAADCWLSLNVSPDVILQRTRLAALLAGRTRRIVLEITEHVEIDHYPSVRRAVAGFGPLVSLAVDDTGAGFASLRHVVELSPRFLKLDLSLVRHVDRDPTRQAMIAGLREFARRVGCEVIAEGIERPAELETLRELGVALGQGYLLGHPVAVAPSPAAARQPGPSTGACRPVGVLAGPRGARPRQPRGVQRPGRPPVARG
jgi:PAS domain S-box-containing protein